MSSNHRQPGSGETRERGSLYQEVTDRIIAELEAGRVPWVQPWGQGKARLGLPRNAATGRRYSGVNILILWGAVIERGYPSQDWLTFRQALDLGGHVRKGERGTTVCYADRFIPKAELERARQEGDEPEAVPFLKRFTVFNVAQCDDLPERFSATAEPLPEREIIPRAEALIAASGADFRIGGASAFYMPSADYIQVPPQPAFSRADQLLPHLLSRAWPLDRPSLAARARSLRRLRLQDLRARGACRRDRERLRLRLARHPADRAPRGLPRLMA